MFAINICLQFTGYKLPGMHPSLQVFHRIQCTPIRGFHLIANLFEFNGGDGDAQGGVEIKKAQAPKPLYYSRPLTLNFRLSDMTHGISYICIPITESDPGLFRKAFAEAERAAADVIELRADYLDLDLAGICELLEDLARNSSAPLLLTYRPAGQGGMRELSLDDRRAFWGRLPAALAGRLEYADFELDLVESLAGSTPPVPWEKVICSWHDFEGTPEWLDEQYRRMAATPAGVVKIATRAVRIGDCISILDLIERAGRPVIALGMGMPGLMTRVLSISRGALLTFGSLRRGAESAPGQPTAGELRDLYRVKELTPESEIYGVIGNPIGHSRSPQMHNPQLRAAGRNGVYLPFEVEDLDAFVADFVRPASRRIRWNLRGLSVTIPHKLAIMKHLDFIDEAARKVGAVNTVVAAGDELHGYNTDVAGAMKPLDDVMDVRGAEVAVIGAGGAARAVCCGLEERGARITVFARDIRKAQALAAEFGGFAAPVEAFSMSGGGGSVGGRVDLVINCTPIGMQGHSEGISPLPAGSLAKVRLVYDLVYNPLETRLLRDAAEAGCRTLGGLEMLRGQASEQFRLWTGKGFDEKP